MTKSKLSIFFDSFLITTISCILVYIWINRYLKNAFFSFFICNIIYIILFYIIFKHLTNKFNLNKIKLSDQKNADNYLNFIIYSDDNSNAEFFENLLSSEKITNQLYKNNLTFFYINLKTTLSETDFHSANNFYQNTKKSIPLIFICKEASNSFSELLNNSPTNYNMVNYYELYNLMKIKNMYPTKLENKNIKFNKLKKFKNKALTSLTKNHFFKFLFSGLSLILISIFIPYSFYYMIFGTILLFFAIVCLFNKNQSNISNNKIDLTSLTKKD